LSGRKAFLKSLGDFVYTKKKVDVGKPEGKPDNVKPEKNTKG